MIIIQLMCFLCFYDIVDNPANDSSREKGSYFGALHNAKDFQFIFFLSYEALKMTWMKYSPHQGVRVYFCLFVSGLYRKLSISYSLHEFNTVYVSCHQVLQ